jgi:hypothetical protein
MRCCSVAFDAVDGSSAGIAMCQIAVLWRTAREEPSMGEISTIGLDIAKHVFQVHGIDRERVRFWFGVS